MHIFIDTVFAETELEFAIIDYVTGTACCNTFGEILAAVKYSLLILHLELFFPLKI